MAPICQRKCWFPHAPHTLCGKPPASRLQASRWALLTAKRHCVAWIYSPKQSGSRQESRLESIYNPAEIHLQYLPEAVLSAVIELVLNKPLVSVRSQALIATGLDASH